LYDLGYDSLGLNAWYGDLEEEVFKSYGFKDVGYGNTYVMKL